MTFCQSKGGIPYFETSAKEAINVEQAFEGRNIVQPDLMGTGAPHNYANMITNICNSNRSQRFSTGGV